MPTRNEMPAILNAPSGSIEVREVGNGRRRISVVTVRPGDSVLLARCETEYPVDLIELILLVKGAGSLCDEIIREESPNYVRHFLQKTLFAFISPDEARGKRLLDYGCGCGASTVSLGKLLPATEISGSDIDGALLEIANARRQFRGLTNIRYCLVADPLQTYGEPSSYDYIVLNGVIEHLNSAERSTVLPGLWDRLRPHGILFISETPHRYAPVETHTTSLPAINYVPDWLALRLARRFSKRVKADASWESLLRAGIRGSTEGEVLGILRRARGGTPTALRPHRIGLRDRYDLWSAVTAPYIPFAARVCTTFTLRTIERLTGIGMVPTLSMAVQKTA
jgi:2-polyprenyl-3-methyl-5-hydroxy-6-metoxy-1,4-benzoquinol methylase